MNTYSLNSSAVAGNVLDIVLFGVLILFALIGLKVGFVNKLVGIVSSVLSMVAAFFLCKPFASFLNNSFDLDEAIYKKTLPFFSKDPFDKQVVSSDDANAILKTENLPAFIRKAVLKKFETGDTLGTLVSDVISKYCTLAIAFIILLLAIKILSLLIRLIFSRVEKKVPALAVTNRLLGCVLGALQGATYIYLFLFVVSIIPSSVLVSLHNAVEAGKVCNFLSEHNILAKFFSWLF